MAIWANLAEPGFCTIMAFEAWLRFRRRESDLLDGESDRDQPLFCAVTKAGWLIKQRFSAALSPATFLAGGRIGRV